MLQGALGQQSQLSAHFLDHFGLFPGLDMSLAAEFRQEPQRGRHRQNTRDPARNPGQLERQQGLGIHAAGGDLRIRQDQLLPAGLIGIGRGW